MLSWIMISWGVFVVRFNFWWFMLNDFCNGCISICFWDFIVCIKCDYGRRGLVIGDVMSKCIWIVGF